MCVHVSTCAGHLIESCNQTPVCRARERSHVTRETCCSKEVTFLSIQNVDQPTKKYMPDSCVAIVSGLVCAVCTVVCVSMCLPEYDGCPCVCAEKWRWKCWTCCDSRPLVTLNTQNQKYITLQKNARASPLTHRRTSLPSNTSRNK